MIRKAIITLLTLLALTSVAAWGTSHARSLTLIEGPDWRSSGPAWSASLRDGALRVSHGVECGYALQKKGRGYALQIKGHRAFGFWYLYSFAGSFASPSMVDVRVPLWAPSVLFAGYPAAAFIRGPLRRWRRPRKGLCVKCGYNLTGNTSGICPECGEGI